MARPPKLTAADELAIATALDGRRATQPQLAARYRVSRATIARVAARHRRQPLPTLDAPPAPNSYTAGIDAVAFLESLRAARIEVGAVITSPPYNLRLRTQRKSPPPGNRNRKGGRAVAWQHSRLAESGWDDAGSDDLPQPVYIEQQRAMIAAALALVGDDGVVCYQHQPIHRNGRVDLQTAILDGFPLRQLVIWDRGSSPVQTPSFCPPSYAYIAFIAGRRWQWTGDGRALKARWGAVWRITPETGANPHPAPFPVALAERMVHASGGRPVADPYAGSGTTGIAAHRVGVPFYLGDLATAYQQQFEQRYALETAQAPLPTAG